MQPSQKKKKIITYLTMEELAGYLNDILLVWGKNMLFFFYSNLRNKNLCNLDGDTKTLKDVNIVDK